MYFGVTGARRVAAPRRPDERETLMESTPQPGQGHLAAGLARRPSRGLAGFALAVGLLTFPSVAGASVHPASRLVAATASCGGVSAGAVSSAVGFSVPAPTASPITKHVMVTKLGIDESGTVCTYGAITSLASLSHLVIITYFTLSKAPSPSVALPYIKAQMAQSAAKVGGQKLSYTLSNQNGVEWLYAKLKTTTPVAMTIEFEVAWKGTAIASVEVPRALAKSKLTGLAKLAASNAGI